MTNDDPISRIEAALAAGPTQGPWFHCQPFQRVEKIRTIHGVVPAQRVDFVATEPEPVHKRIVIPMAGEESNVRSEDMAYIAACNPQAIRALLDRLKAAEAENEKLRELADTGRMRPVAWRWIYNGKPTSALCFDGTGPDADIAELAAASENPRTVQRLYAHPPALRLPEPMVDAEIDAALDWHGVPAVNGADDIARAIEAETLRRVRECNQ